MIALAVNNLRFGYDDDDLLADLDLEVKEGEVVALVGENGTGKTTLLELIAGRLQPSAGEIMRRKGSSVGYLEQLPSVTEGMSVRQYLEGAFAPLDAMEKRLREMEERLEQGSGKERLLHDYGEYQARYELAGGYDRDVHLARILTGFGFSEAFLSQAHGTLSGGEKTRVALARLLLEQHDLLLLDEPTNHLDLRTTLWLESFIAERHLTILMVSHDRAFMNRTVKKIYELEEGRAVCYLGDYDTFRAERALRRERLLAAYEAQKKEVARMEEAIDRFRRWGDQGDNAKFFKKAKMLERRIDKMEDRRAPCRERRLRGLGFSSQGRASKEAIRLEGLSHAYGGERLFEPIEKTLFAGERIALVGDNGVGKSTLLRLILGLETPEEGGVVLGPSTEVAYLPQEVQFDEEAISLLEEIRRTLHFGEQAAREHLARFHFYQESVFRPLSSLSGGERTRLKLSELIAGSFNCLILDEPTNHLDLPAREQLEEALESFGGTVLVVSHDRYFNDRVVDRFWILTPGGIEVWEGPIETYLMPETEDAVVEVRASLAEEEGAPPARRMNPWKVAELEEEIEQVEIELFDLSEAVEEAGSDHLKLMRLHEKIRVSTEKRDGLIEAWMRAQGEGEDLS